MLVILKSPCGILALTMILGSTLAQGQISASCEQLTAFPFLLIAPDAAAAGRGETGVATLADINSSYYNIGKLAFNKSKGGASLSYTPWLRKVFNGASLSYLSGFWKANEEQALTGSITYFNLGNLQTITGDAAGSNRSFALGYSRKLNEHLSLGLGARYTQSDLDFNNLVNAGRVTSDNTFSLDIGFYYQNHIKKREDLQYSVGLAIVNIGPKVGYSGVVEKDFSPTNLRMGGAVIWQSPIDYTVQLSLDLSKLMVPSCSNFDKDTGIFGSFSDAPGGFREELQEINLNTGLELWVSQTLAARIGYVYQSPKKGQNTYFTFGLGGKYRIVNADIAYYLPRDNNHPLRETVRFTLGVEID